MARIESVPKEKLRRKDWTMENSSIKKSVARLCLSLGIPVGALALTLFLFAPVERAFAAVDPSDITFTVRGASTFYMDSNAFCNNTAGPDGMWLPLEIVNNHATDAATGLQLEFEPPLNTNADDTFRYIGNLGPGEAVEVFFYTDYSPLRTNPNCTTINNQDNWYSEDYTVTLRSLDGSGSLSTPAVFDTDTFDTVRMISAAAGGTRTSDIMGPGASVGQVLTQTVVYDFGNNTGSNDLFFQPTGNGATFRDDCFRLIGAEITQSDITGVNVGVTDQLFFTNLSTSNGDQVTIDYEWLVLCSPGVVTQVYAWAEMTSGTQFKYASGGYGPTDFPLPNPVTGQITINKNVQVPANFQFGLDDPLVVTYTVEVANAYTLPLVLARVTDILDPNMAFMDELGSSDIDENNSTVSPNTSDSGQLDWFGQPPDGSYVIPAQGAINLIYQVAIDYDAGSVDPQQFTNTVTVTIGSETVGPAAALVTIEPGSATNVLLNATEVAETGAIRLWHVIMALLLLAASTAVILNRYRLQTLPVRQE
jgi:hypothetical protein